MLSINVCEDTLVIYVEAKGLDVNVGAVFKQEVAPLLDTPLDHVVLDLASVAYIDTFGLSALIYALNCARRKWKTFHLTNVAPAVKYILELTRLVELFPIEPSRQKLVV